jgi:outer membrane protein assembly factor BamD
MLVTGITSEDFNMHYRFIAAATFCLAIMLGAVPLALAQSKPQSDLTAAQRLEVMRSKLESLRRSLTSGISSLPSKSTDKKQAVDDPRQRLQGLEKEVASILSEVNDIRGKQDRSERYDATALDRLEASVVDIDTRSQAGLQATASARTASVASNASTRKKKKGKFLGIFGGSDDDKYAELTGEVAAGRDRVLFQEAAKQVRKGSHETGRLLFTTIINTYPDSPFLPLAKLAIADSFYLEGTTSNLIQAAQAYQDWLTFFPTDPLADDAMLKVAESEMRQMGLSDRDISHARKAEQRLKVLLQQFPQTKLRPEVEQRLSEVQENLAMHNLQIGNFYYKAKYEQQKGGLKGAQSRYREIVEKYPNFSFMDEVLYRLAATYQQEEEPDEAAKYYQQLLRNHPNSEFAEKSREQLGIIGAPVPDPDPARKGAPPPVRPGMLGNLLQQVSGRADVTVNKNGVLISKDGKEGSDLIDEAMKNDGQIPHNITPQAPTQRRERKPAPANATPPAGDQKSSPAATTVPVSNPVKP